MSRRAGTAVLPAAGVLLVVLRVVVVAGLAVGLVVGLAACAAPSGPTSPPVPPSASASSASASSASASSASASSASASAGAPSAGAPTCNATASYAPVGPLPQPGRMPEGSAMARIAARGRLIVATSGDKPLLAARDPRTGDLAGIDIDLARAVAAAIFGDPSKVDFRTVPYAAREQVLVDGQVDMVAHSMTMTCDRWTRIGFSSEYFRDGQRLLVRTDSTAREVEDLAGQRVCVARGTTTIDNLRRFPRLVVVPVDDAADCLVLFQRGEVDALTGNEIVLLGYRMQDPWAKLIGRNLSDEPRGLAFRRDDVDLIRFVNGVLEHLRADGALSRILASRLTPLGLPVAVRPPVYGRLP